MVHQDQQVEPIVPIEKLAKELGCKFEWKDGTCTLNHPEKGEVVVAIVENCPQIASEVALQLIDELEDGASLKSLQRSDREVKYAEADWLEKLREVHPICKTVPEDLQKKLVDTPAADLSKLGVNRRIRKRWQKEGVIVHLYAGPDAGYTLRRAVKECGGDQTGIYELDIVRGRADDMIADDAKYAALLRMAMDGWIDGDVGQSTTHGEFQT